MATKRKTKKIDKKDILIRIVIALLALGVFYVVAKLIIKPFAILSAVAIQQGFREIFKGTFNLSYFLAALLFTFVAFVYISLFFVLYFLITDYKPSKKSVIQGLIDSTNYVLDKRKNLFFLILTFTISFALMTSGILFLSTAFPAEPLFYKGVTSGVGSTLKCGSGDYLNIISTWDVQCTIKLNASEFNGSKLEYAQISYYINRMEFKENLSSFSRERAILYFDKEKKPQFLRLHFDDNGEVFPLNTKGVYTKEEYFEREKEKAVWFFAIVSFSLFSVFSAMANLKRILKE